MSFTRAVSRIDIRTSRARVRQRAPQIGGSHAANESVRVLPAAESPKHRQHGDVRVCVSASERTHYPRATPPDWVTT